MFIAIIETMESVVTETLLYRSINTNTSVTRKKYDAKRLNV